MSRIYTGIGVWNQHRGKRSRVATHPFRQPEFGQITIKVSIPSTLVAPSNMQCIGTPQRIPVC